MSEQMDYYSVLGVDRHARQEDIAAAFDEMIATRRARRRANGDVHAAFSVLSQPALRAAYDAVLFGRSASERLSDARDAAIEVLPEVNWVELGRSARQTALKAAFLVSGVTAKTADIAGALSRKIQVAAARRLNETGDES